MDSIVLGRAFAMAMREYGADERERKKGLPPSMAGQIARRLHEVAGTQSTAAELFFWERDDSRKEADERTVRRHESDGPMSFDKARDALSSLMTHALLWERGDLYREAVAMWTWVDIFHASRETVATLRRRKRLDGADILNVFRRHLVKIARAEMPANEVGLKRFLRDRGTDWEDWEHYVGTIVSQMPGLAGSAAVH
ncbi:hypothetical protein [Ralstonia pseudosolanacearum]|uniref:hypothetical protein n=1 Tax=Ralstonia pseudosolanacearum TaxID=1310165 RepID=UPI001FFC20DC|nr:hypothetical protein [Ralstonia pseudosolanacearum]